MGESSTKKLTKKEQKVAAFKSKKKSKAPSSSKSENILPVPEDDEEVVVEQPAEKASSSLSPSSKKRKRSEEESATQFTPTQDEASTSQPITTTASKRRKRKKAAKLKEAEEGEKRKSSKLILFVGNLPFDITTERLKTFFSEHCSEEPIVRLMSEKPKDPTSRPKGNLATKGYGFIEFKTSAALQKALRLHHTPISSDRNKSKTENGKRTRLINIELTAGGGGRSETRMKKIQDSQLRLDKQREKILKNLKSKSEKKKANNSLQPSEESGPGSKQSSLQTPHTSQTQVHPYKPGFKPQLSGGNAIKLS